MGSLRRPQLPPIRLGSNVHRGRHSRRGPGVAAEDGDCPGRPLSHRRVASARDSGWSLVRPTRCRVRAACAGGRQRPPCSRSLPARIRPPLDCRPVAHTRRNRRKRSCRAPLACSTRGDPRRPRPKQVRTVALRELSGRSPDVRRPAGMWCLAGGSFTAVVPCCPRVADRLRAKRGPLPGAHDQRRLDAVNQDAGACVLHHRDAPSGHLGAR